MSYSPYAYVLAAYLCVLMRMLSEGVMFLIPSLLSEVIMIFRKKGMWEMLGNKVEVAEGFYASIILRSDPTE